MIRKAIKLALHTLGYDIVKRNNTVQPGSLSQKTAQLKTPPDFESEHIAILKTVIPYTVTSPERIYSLIESVRYVLHNDIKGSFLECGVYKGGSMMTIALVLLQEGVTDRDLYLLDTFEGMPLPEERDVDLWGKPAMNEFSKNRISDASSTWANASLEDVKQAMASTGYPMEKVHFVKGLVENTLPDKAPDAIALLRLDTDWYQSTMHELVHLYPRLSPQGVLIVDDYGHFKGAREAVDEYFQENNLAPFLHRVDYTARLILKAS
ncbi:MAG: TylF/MycF/NovP-related O-methyltransferase [Cyanobacteria bacterium J06638_28]